MNKYPKDLWEWKEQCRQENSQLTQAEYLEKLQQIAQTVSAQYHLNLPTQKRTL